MDIERGTWESFFSVYENIRKSFAECFPKNYSPTQVFCLDLGKGVSHNKLSELFSVFATDMLISNKLVGKFLFSIEDFGPFNDRFYQEFDQVYKRLENELQPFNFTLNDSIGKKNIIDPSIFHLLGENLVRKTVLDSGAVFSPPGIVKFLSVQTMMFYLEKNTNLTRIQILELIKNPDLKIIQILNDEELEQLCEILKSIRILDPACGTGLFFFEMGVLLEDLFKKLSGKFAKVTLVDIFRNNLFGIDINPYIIFKLRFLLQIILFKSEGRILEDRIFLTKHFICEDSLLVGRKRWKKFDILIGNPPYVRQENIRSQGIHNFRDHSYSALLYKNMIIEKNNPENHNQFRINKRSDLYIYFFYYAFNHLDKNGIVSFLTSNSWLNIGFGFDFQKYILDTTEICSIVDFDIRAFSSAEINTVITTLCINKPEKEKLNNYFIKLKTALGPGEAVNIVQNIYINDKKDKNSFGSISEYNSSQFQVREVPQSEIISRTRWGNELLLAPPLYFKLKDQIGKKILRLHNIADITRGITTGLNKFFILKKISENNGIFTVKNGFDYQFQIEAKYLRPFLNGPKRMLNPVLNQSKLRYFLLYIPHEFDENKPSLAKEYIKYGKSQKIELTKGKNKGKHIYGAQNVPTLKIKDRYYSIKVPNLSIGTQIFIQKIFSSKYKIYFSSTDSTILANNTFYNINLKPEFTQYFSLIIASLLSSITYLTIELNGRRSFGMGALDTATFDIENMMIVDPRKLDPRIHIELKNCVESISSRKFLEVNEEFQLDDRRNLDNLLLEHLNLRDQQLKLYEGIESLVHQRISKSQTYKRK